MGKARYYSDIGICGVFKMIYEERYSGINKVGAREKKYQPVWT